MILLVLVLFSTVLFSQECSISKKAVERLKKDVEYLSDDKLEGREIGSIGEQLALEYLTKRLKSIGIKSSVHKFKFNRNVKVIFSSNVLNLYPTKYSSNATIENTEIIDVKYGIEAKDLGYSDYKNLDVKDKVFLINTSSPDGIHPHSKYSNYHNLKLRTEIAKKKGAVGVIYYTNDNYAETPEEKFRMINSVEIPVLFYNDIKENLPKKISFRVDLKEEVVEGKNLIAKIDNGSENTIIIGAHYDHLGWGKEGSLYSGELKIHNGADDNASGTAGLLELARIYSKSKYKNYNYLFIAFSGEEKGLLGSNAYVKSDFFEASKTNYMFNMDMIGRLGEDGEIEVFGTGTSPRWKSLLARSPIKKDY